MGEGCGRWPRRTSHAPFLRRALRATDNGRRAGTGLLCCCAALGAAGEPRLFLRQAPQPRAAVPAAGAEGERAEGHRTCWKHLLVAQPPGRRYPRLAAAPAPVTPPGRAAGPGMAAHTRAAPGQGTGCQGQRLRRSSAGTAVAETLCGFRCAFLSHFLHAGQEGCVLAGYGEQGLGSPRCLPCHGRARGLPG